MDLGLSLLALSVLIALNAAFSAVEVAYLTISRIRLHRLLERKLPGSESLARLKAQSNRTIIAILIGSNVAGVAASVLAADIAVGLFGDVGLGIATGFMTLLLLTVGEVTPKTLASSHAEPIILFFSAPLEALVFLLSPFVSAFDAFNRAVAGPHAKSVSKITEDEVRAAVTLGAQDQAITALEKHYIENVLHFNDKTVAQCMTPKSRTATLAPDEPIPAALQKALQSPYSRFPVVKEGKAVGIVTVKRLAYAAQNQKDATVADVMRTPALTLPKTLPANEAFARMQAAAVNMAAITGDNDDYAGLVTLEDLLEELVGEIA